jgi:hypothetical protein
MASERKPGQGGLAAGLIRSTTPHEAIPPEPADDRAEGRAGEVIRADAPEARTPEPKGRRKRAPSPARRRAANSPSRTTSTPLRSRTLARALMNENWRTTP